MPIVQKYQIKFGAYTCLGLSCANALSDYIKSDFVTSIHEAVISFIVIFMTMFLVWIIAYRLLHSVNDEDGFYRLQDIFRILVYCFILLLPILVLGYWFLEMFLETFDVKEYIAISFLRIVFVFGVVLLFKYLKDSREVAMSYLEQSRKLQTDNDKARFEILKQQINPHFLFNSLSTLKSLIRIQDPNAEKFVMSLSDVYRKLLTRREQELVRLVDEMEIVDACLFMQKLRFESNLQTEVTLSPDDLQRYIPPFALQLLVENTIKHNIISRKHPLRIHIFVADNKVVVENTKQPKKTVEESTGWGLSSLAERYTLFTPIPIDIQETETVFSVGLPLLNEG